ncbi:hypothetical protein, partial [Hydrogenimonas thermophila]
IMQCDFTPEALVVLRDKGFQIVSDPNEADYRLDVEVLACGFHTTTDTSHDRISILYRQRKEVPLKEKPLYKDFMAVAYSEKVPPYFSMIAEYLKKNPDEGMRMFHQYGILYRKNSRYFEHSWHRIVTDGAQYEILKTKGYLYPKKYAGIPEEDKEFVKKWLKSSVEQKDIAQFSTLSSAIGYVDLGNSLNSIGHSGAGTASAALGVAVLLFSKRPGEAADRFTLTNMKTGKKVFVDYDYLLSGKFGWKNVIGKDDLDWVEKHLDEVFDKL